MVIAPTVSMTHATLKTVTANTSPQTVVISSNTVPSSTVMQTSPVQMNNSRSISPQVHSSNDDSMTKYSQENHFRGSLNWEVEQDGQVTSSTTTTVAQAQTPRQRYLNNSFDIMNPLVIDELNGDTKRRQPPMVFRAGTREVHNKLEKHRRAHLKECFDILKKQIPSQEDKKTSNLSILHSAFRYIQLLKRKERELEHEMERLAREKISHQQRIAILKKEISSHYDNVDFSKLLPEVVPTAPTAVSDVTTTVVPPAPPPVGVDMNQHEVEAAIVTVQQNGGGQHLEQAQMALPVLAAKPPNSIPVVTQAVNSIKEVPQPVQATTLSVLPMTYPVNQGLVLQKVAIVPKALDGLAPLVSTHFITAPQQINGKVVPLTQYLRPVVVVSTASPRPS
ncbi:unnamed protein product [Acanthoscelides obtectus]|uniref:Max-binding protein MNT n=1 Tax=Acanthoscelides obtectus TaxID=200917 RepID=A0A9P0LUD0_ACAOB|nr:unnamed protein product [Acanthoscelides obtectus]CAK1665113.1 Max-binding protein MNT [Acanthoscelides obtectus]